MNAPTLTDVSLYDLALSVENPPHSLRVSPTVFKSVVETVFDHLLETEQAASIWLKLPRGEAWQSDVYRYLDACASTEPVYVLKNQRDIDLDEPRPDAVTAAVDEGDVDEQDTECRRVDDPNGMPIALSSLIELPIADASRLRREYFVLVLSPEFCFLVLAHRPRSVRSPNEQDMPAFHGLAANAPAADDYEQKQMLFGLCSFEPQTLVPVLDGIKQAIALGQTLVDAHSEASSVLAQWDQITAQVSDQSLNSRQVGQFLSRQIQRQEQIWHTSAVSRKQAELASVTQRENEELLNQLRLKNEFLKAVGQELRTPLTTMKTALTLLNSSSLKLPQRQRYMNLLRQECDRQSSLITSVLDLIQLEDIDDQVSIQPLRLADVVPGVVSTYQALAQEKGLALSCSVAADLPAIACLGAWMRQIVIHLLHNAIKFTPRGGQVRVRARLQGDFVQLEFRDTGVGIATSDIPKIFNRFYRVRHSVQQDIDGSGLGLSIVHQLLLRCGGSVSVVSKVGEGSAFSVLIPVYHQDHQLL